MPEHNISTFGISLKIFSRSTLEESFWNDYANGKWEPEYLSFLVNHRKGNVFLDIGSWIGPVTLLMSKFYDQVISIDIDPEANKSFRLNLSLNSVSNVLLYEVGFSDKSGTVFISSENLGSSMTSIYSKSGNNAVKVSLMRFDEFISKCPLRNEIGFIKIDCEGAEYKFLDQVYALMRKQPLRVLISYHPFVLKKPQYYFIKLYHWFMQLQFKRYYFTKQGKIIVKRSFQPVIRLVDMFPMADVIES